MAAFLGCVTEAALPRANLLLLGAGLDTLAFRLLAASAAASNQSPTVGREAPGTSATATLTPAASAATAAAEAGVTISCVDVDLAPVARFKAGCLRASPELLAAVGGEAVAGEAADVGAGLEPAATTVVFRGQGGGYVLVAGDLGDTAGLEGERLFHAA